MRQPPPLAAVPTCLESDTRALCGVHAQTGLEPRKLFNVVEFMMHDKDSSGTIDMDECMEILFRRFGKEDLEQRTNEFFKHDLDGDNNISFMEFQKQMNSIRPKKREKTGNA